MATLQLPPLQPTLTSRPKAWVLIRQNWSDPWLYAPYLQALECVEAAAPSMPTARIRYHAGTIKREDRNAYTDEAYNGTLVGWFLRIMVGGPGYEAGPVWTGRIVDEDEKNPGSAAGKTRDYDLNALGLAGDLDRTHIFGAYATSTGAASAIQIGRSIPFNDRFVYGLREIGNRSNVKVQSRGGKLAYAFAGYRDNSFTTRVWTVRDVVEYLLINYAPDDRVWALAGQAAALSLMEPPRIDTAGMTVWQVLDQLIDRRRGVGFWIDASGNNAILRIFTTVGHDVPFDKRTLPGNPNRTLLDLDKYGHAIDEPSIRIDDCATYDRIRVQGAPLVSCFTVSNEDATLIAGWTAAKETAYKTAASSIGEKNDHERATEKFDHVYAKFLVPERTWNWMAGDGQTQKRGTSKHCAHPISQIDGVVPINGPAVNFGLGNYRTFGHTFLRHLPLLKDQQDAADPEAAEPEFKDPLVLVYDEQLQTYRTADTSTAADDIAGSVRPLDRELGFILKMTPNHLLAKQDFPGAQPSKTQPKYEWRKIIATFACRVDAHLQVTREINKTGNRVLLINIVDAETWFILDGTVVGVTKGDPQREPKTRLIRDDGARLRQVGAFAAAWCQEPRAVLNLPLHIHWQRTPVGTFITKVRDSRGERNVNSVVSQVLHDLEEMKSTVQTNYGELDFASAAGGNGTILLH